jgi:hypothetical protein
VAEEDGDAEEDKNEEDVDFLANVLVGEGDGKVCGGLDHVVGLGFDRLTDCKDDEQEGTRESSGNQLSSCCSALDVGKCATLALPPLPVGGLGVPSPPAPPPSLSVDLSCELFCFRVCGAGLARKWRIH